MPTPDAAALAGLSAQSGIDADFIWLDFVGAPVRACTWYDDVTLAGTGDSELDGTYEAVDPNFLDLGAIAFGEGGSETSTISLSGIVGIDTAALNLIGDRSKWNRRIVRAWLRVHDESGVQQGAIVPYYTGFMVDVRIVSGPEAQTIQISLEHYLSMLSGASMRTYADQGDFDSADISARATLAAASGASAGPAASVARGGSFAGVAESAIRLTKKS